MARLNVPYDFSFELIALLSSKKPHKLAWEINRIFGFSLIRTVDICLNFDKEFDMYFINYLYKTDHLSVRLIKNKSVSDMENPGGFLLPELNQYDYFLIVEDFSEELTSEYITDILRNQQGIEHLLQVEADNLKNKENLLF